jgi:hypothetical protein
LSDAKVKDGSAAAAILAGGIGIAVTGIVSAMAEAIASFSSALAWSSAVGALMGKTIIGIAAWLVSWIILSRVWKDTDVKFAPVLVVSAVLLAAGALLTFPPVFELIAGK